MKRFLTLMTLSIGFSAFLIGAVNASNDGANQNNIIANPLVVANYSGGNDNPIKDFVHNVAEETLSNPEIQEQITLKDMRILNLIDETIVTNDLTFVVSQPNDEIFYLLIEATQNDLDKIINTIEDFETLERTEYNGSTIYSTYNRDDLAFTYRNGSIISSDSIEDLEQVINTLNNDTADLSDIYSNIPSDSFFSLIITEAEGNTKNLPINTTTEFQWISITETSNDHFEITQFTEGKQSVLDSHNFKYTDYEFTPKLYTKIPGESPFMYLELNNIVSYLEDSLAMLEMENEYRNALEEANEVVSTGPLMEILDGNIAFSLEFTDKGEIPYFTFVSDTTNQNIQETNDFIIEELNLEDQTQIVDGLTVITEDLNTIGIPENGQATISFGEIDDHYVISTNPNLAQEFGGASTLSNSSKFTNKFGSSLNTELLAVTYIDLANMTDYLRRFDDQGQANEIMDFLSSLDPWYGTTTVTDYTSTQESNIHLPVSKLSDLVIEEIKKEQSIFKSRSYKWQFSDVDFDTAWYSEDLKKTYRAGVIKGSNFEFRPSADTTRAEFVTMLIRHYDLEDSQAPLGSDIFTDVKPDKWYNENIGIAYDIGLIKGDENGQTVRPNDPIARAEAVQMLSNFSGALFGVEPQPIPFKDVEAGAYYEDAVSKAAQKEIVKGTEPEFFEPKKTLNRAEAAALLNRLQANEIQIFRSLPKL